MAAAAPQPTQRTLDILFNWPPPEPAPQVWESVQACVVVFAQVKLKQDKAACVTPLCIAAPQAGLALVLMKKYNLTLDKIVTLPDNSEFRLDYFGKKLVVKLSSGCKEGRSLQPVENQTWYLREDTLRTFAEKLPGHTLAIKGPHITEIT